MQKFTALLFVVLASFITVNSQNRGRPDPTPMSETDKAIQRSNDISRRSSELRNTENFPVNTRKNNRKFREAIDALYREPNKEERKMLEPKPELANEYSSFLKQKNTGLLKLIKDNKCADIPNVVDASKECAKYSMPGAGSAYSFREETYRIKNLADINYTGKSFEALGVLLHGIMVNLGNVPIEQVDSDTSGYRFIKKAEPADDFKKAADFANKLQKGIKDNDLLYASILPVQENSTYILRSIAYKGVAPRTVEGVAYNELDFDKRKDITIAFRVVDKDDESVTILWKELENKKSPTLELNK